MGRVGPCGVYQWTGHDVLLLGARLSSLLANSSGVRGGPSGHTGIVDSPIGGDYLITVVLA